MQLPRQFKPMSAEVEPCDAEIQVVHLRSFAESFIQENFVARWIHCTIERPSKARACLYKFQKQHRPERCKEVSGTGMWPETLTQLYGTNRGLFFTGIGPGVLTTIGHAATVGGDALFSLVPGEFAVFFFHEGWAWVCTK
jgi:hypothetical protein